MPGWSAFHDWMAFDRLSESDGLTRAFTIGYRLTVIATTRGRLASMRSRGRSARLFGAVQQ